MLEIAERGYRFVDVRKADVKGKCLGRDKNVEQHLVAEWFQNQKFSRFIQLLILALEPAKVPRSQTQSLLPRLGFDVPEPCRYRVIGVATESYGLPDDFRRAANLDGLIAVFWFGLPGSSSHAWVCRGEMGRPSCNGAYRPATAAGWNTSRLAI